MNPLIFTVNVAVWNTFVLVVLVESTCCQLDPSSMEYHNCHVDEASEPYLACCIVTTPAPEVKLNFIVILPLRIRADLVPFLTSAGELPIKASLKFHTPVPRVTSAAP